MSRFHPKPIMIIPFNRTSETLGRPFLALAVSICFCFHTATLCGLDGSQSPWFEDVTQETGIDFLHSDGSSGRHYIVEYVSSGLAVFDYDGDGDEDIYFLNGGRLPGLENGPEACNQLWRNDGNWRFSNVTDLAGVGDTGHGLGVTAGDYDNDGDLDLYVNNFGPNILYRNNGNGTFTDVTFHAGVANGDRVGAGVCFLDIDRDGFLDLYVSNYVRFSFDQHVARTRMGLAMYPSPRDYEPDPDTLYRNRGDGTFEDISLKSGIGHYAAPGMGMICADADADGDTDILVGNDVDGNFLFINDGWGRFEEYGLMSGFAFDFGGKEHGSMGVEAGDVDNDGLPDLHVTSYQHELATLYRNLGSGLFEDVTIRSSAGNGTRSNVTWGNCLADFNNDGWPDLFIACGHLNDQVEKYDTTTRYKAPNLLFLNNGNGIFTSLAGKAGPGMEVEKSSRGAGAADFDLDGDLDLVILNSRDRPTLLRNDLAQKGHWIDIRLAGDLDNRFGVGARVRVTAGQLRQTQEVHSGRSYQSHYGLTLHFGLGDASEIDQVEVLWLKGEPQVFDGPFPADRRVVIDQKHGFLPEFHSWSFDE